MSKQFDLFTSTENYQPFDEICKSLGVEVNTPGWPDIFGNKIKQYLQDNNYIGIRTLSLFSGAGGLDIGFSDVGFDIIESVEIEEKFCKSLELNTGIGKRFCNSKVNCIDVRNYTSSHLGNIDFIIGGPPCQTFSAAGRRANGVLGTTDARGVLFKEYVRLLTELQPVGFLFENVYGIIGAQGGEPWREIQESFSKVGYHLYFRIIDAADYGVPQHRERAIIVGLKEGSYKFPRPTHGPDSINDLSFYNAGTAVRGLTLSTAEKKVGINGRYGKLLDNIPPGLNYSFYTEEMGHPEPIFAWRSKFSDFLYKADPEEPVRTIKASGGAYTGPFHWENRFFAYPEYKRLQTFPDDYIISGSFQTAVKQIGNSVPPQMARIMAIAIREQVFNTQFPFVLSYLKDYEELLFRKRKRGLTEMYRAKAKQAIRTLSNSDVKKPQSHNYFCRFTEDFDFLIVDKEEANYNMVVSWGEKLVIEVSPNKEGKKVQFACLNIDTNKVVKSLGVESVVIKIYSKDAIAITAGWRCFEHELIKNNIKADLVQLNGYYQNVAKLQSVCELSSDYRYSSAIINVTSGDCVGEIVNTSFLAEKWALDETEVFGAAEFLRSLGYEIRNHNTNPQIDEGYWLVPYAFPTLTKYSVQYRKKL